MIRNKNHQGGQGVQEEAQGGLPSKNVFCKTCSEASDDLKTKISSKVSKVYYPMIRNKNPQGGQGVQEEAQGVLPSKTFFSKTCS